MMNEGEINMKHILYKMIYLITFCFVAYYLFYHNAFVNKFRYLYYIKEDKSIERLSDAEILSDLAIVIPSCDDYSELWSITITSLLKYWPSLNTKHNSLPIYLITKHESFVHNRVVNLKLGDDVSWSDNLIKALGKIDKKYILMILDDYIINQPVNERRFIELYRVFLQFNAPYMNMSLEARFPFLQDGPMLSNNVMIRNRMGEYRNSTQISLWQKQDLLSLLKPGENAWQFALQGNERTRSFLRPFLWSMHTAPFFYLNAVVKRKYQQYAVEILNNSGYNFHPTKLPIE